MGIDTTAHLIYGMQIEDAEPDDLETGLKGNTVGVGYLHAGPYDYASTYLCTAYFSADLRDGAEAVDLGSAYADGDPTGRWDAALAHAVDKLGTTQKTEPGWYLIAGHS